MSSADLQHFTRGKVERQGHRGPGASRLYPDSGEQRDKNPAGVVPPQVLRRRRRARDLAQARAMGEAPKRRPRELRSLDEALATPCPRFVNLLKADCCGTTFAKLRVCAQDFCKSCGGKNGAAHNRRFANNVWKLRKMLFVHHVIVTIPPEVRNQFRDQGKRADLAAKNIRWCKRNGIKRGFYGWHLYGEPPKDGTPPKFHPHLDMLWGTGYVAPAKGKAYKSFVAKTLGVDPKRVNVRFEGYTRKPGKMLHGLRYCFRPTMLDPGWDWDLAERVRGCRLRGSWGNFDVGPYLWDLRNGESEVSVLAALGAGRCPYHGGLLRGEGGMPPDMWESSAGLWRPQGGGYYENCRSP